MFVGIFGREWGCVLCWEVGLEARREKWLVVRYPLRELLPPCPDLICSALLCLLYRGFRSCLRTKADDANTDSLTFFSIAWEATTISLIATVEMSEGLTVLLIFGAIFGGILLFVCMILQCMGFPSEKKTLERELKRVLTAHVSEQVKSEGEGRAKWE